MPPPQKWNYDEDRLLITAKERITNDDVEEVLEWAFNLRIVTRIYIYSGVHGVPGGALQVVDDDFYKKDLELVNSGAGTTADPHVTVVKKLFSNKPEKVLEDRVNDQNRIVILAWCYSDGYM